MTWYEFLLFVHITAAVIWLGGAFTFQMYGFVVRRGGDPEEMARFAERSTTRPLAFPNRSALLVAQPVQMGFARMFQISSSTLG